MPDKVGPAEQQPLRKTPSSDDGIRLKKDLGLLDGVAIIVGVIVGAGIFVSPKSVLEHSGSVGQALLIWISSGFLCLIGALCYAELGTMIPKSGGDYAYISDAFGPLPAFLYLWVALFILVPTGNAITALTFAQYILQPVWPDCPAPYLAVRLLAAVITCLLTAINCYNVKWATRIQDIFTGTKIFALLIIIVAGLVWLCMGNTENFRQPMAGTNTDPGHIALAAYAGLFSYSGWNYLNFVTEELKDPYKNLPKAICISLPLITIIYVLANVAYFAVLTQSEILVSDAVAVKFGNKLLGVMSWIMPFFVACSTFGALNGAIFASSRLFFVGARNGHLPTAIALINVNNLTPMPSLIFLCIITLVLLVIENVSSLITYVSFVEAVFTTLSVSGLLWLRHKCPDLHRPIKVYIALPIVFFMICVFLVVLPCYESPWEVGVGTVLILSGIPVYLIFIQWKRKPRWLVAASHELNMTCAKMFMCVHESKAD
ncbi:large neutral amino acids transporter small subunit 1 [Neodiprion pinetum]|uniref:Large neutral amino acids transporter small subunit 1 n=1 Tax=Neodiprion lecontei TaxID=441921 RepID=A0A6J0BYX1_NEOLC|nr:large neutral amino acids transporter small subunit 1 [Neodiprion lecontei]XP_046410407.1 large neutral amino acids transporter small subunit 1 [Neodiprion fabricii]XP_046410408.1 large neutral amino acids transporter small subunit 1 [Neodiprion fabricii]XP_046410409.1 large neutral amino acids transporter small subunit 1 [Neodiprion fabricii]XP_046466072.1 large neutral amino acids transporter small subunit 1 [Neodiprion pinetum]XP_046466073.1 large neutral amino acids transporter small su